MTTNANISSDYDPSACSAAASGLALRPASPSDEVFLRAVFAGTREEELRLSGWDDATKASFLNMQYRAERLSYLERFPSATYEVVVRDQKSVGRLIVDRASDRITVVHIALLPENRGAGIGTALLSALIDEAHRAGLPVYIHVDQGNRALRLYDRLGFRVIDEAGPYFLMECTERHGCEPPTRGECNVRTVCR